MTVMDLGCGNGSVTHWLTEIGLNAIGVDPSESGISIARRKYPGIPFILADISQPLSPIPLVDMVISLDVIEHLLLPRQLFHRANEVLKPGGFLVISTPYHGYLKNLALAVTGSFDKHWHPLRDFGHVKFFSRRTLVELCVEQGFAVVRLDLAGRIPALAKSMIVLLRKQESR